MKTEGALKLLQTLKLKDFFQPSSHDSEGPINPKIIHDSGETDAFLEATQTYQCLITGLKKFFVLIELICSEKIPSRLLGLEISGTWVTFRQ
jgi:hypothetical protein